MSAQTQFLHSLAHALSAMTLYTPKHPACITAVDSCWSHLLELRKREEEQVFSFLPETVIAGALPLHDLYGWQWSGRLAEIGVQRLEFISGVTRDSLAGFLDDVNGALLGGGETKDTGARRGIRWGLLGVAGEESDPRKGDGSGGDDDPQRPRAPYRLGEEVDVVRWLYQRAGEEGSLSRDEVEAVVASLTVGMQDAGQFLLPLLQSPSMDDYRTVHSINVAVLAMSISESLGMGSHDVHAVGVAGLMHDIGIAKVSPAILAKQTLTREDRKALERHPVEGAKMLLAKNGAFDHAAIVAYEHHMRPNGTGYPRLRFPRELHYVSRIVSVCDVYDALRTERPHRPAWAPADALAYIEEGADTLFDGGIARAFASLMKRVEPALAMPA